VKLFGFEIKRGEARAQSNLVTPGQWLLDLFGGSGTGPTVDKATAISVTAAWSAVNLISNTFATLPFSIKTRDENGDTFDAGHTVTNLLRYEPSGLQNAFTWKHSQMVNVLNEGNSFSYIIRDGSETPTELIPLSPDLTEVIRVENEVFYRIKVGDEFKIVPSSEILHIMGLSLDGLRGVSVIKYHHDTLQESLATRNYSRNLMTKGTNVKGVIEMPGKLNVDQIKKLRESWFNTHGGPQGNDTAILDGGAKFSPVSMTPDQAQYIQLRKYQIGDIARIYGVPPHKIGDLERSTNNNIEHQSIEYVQDTMLPWVTRWEIEIRRKLLRESEKKVFFPKFNLNSIMRGDSTARANFYRTLSEVGALSPDEIRRFEDMNMIEGGNIHTIQINRIPLSQIEEFYKNQNSNTNGEQRTAELNRLDRN